MIDKILLGLLVILLPAGLILSKQFFVPQANNGQVMDEQKVEAVISEIEKEISKNKQVIQDEPKFTITAVTYASTSGVIGLSAVAPDKTAVIWVKTTILPEDPIPEINQTVIKSALGEEADIKALRPKNDGSFTYELPIVKASGVAIINLTQENAMTEIEYDLKLQKQIN